MRRLSILLLICLVGTATAVFAQNPYDDFVSEVKGDTLVVNTYSEQEDANALVNAVNADSVDVPDGRVYQLKSGGWYPLLDDLYTPEARAVVIEGASDTRIAQATSDDPFVPVISGIFLSEDESNEGDLIWNSNDITLRNVAMTPTHGEGTIGWTFFHANAAGYSITLDNVQMETTQWVFLQANDAENISLYISDSYFVNMSGYTCRRNGGVYDNVNHNTDTIIVENTTHVMGSGTIYKFRGYPISKAVFNHNTFVNASGQVLGTWGHQSNYIVTNNLFINSNVQAYITGLDYNEFDQDYLPHGIINVDSLRRNNRDSTGAYTGNEIFGVDSSWVEDNYDMAVSDFGPDDRKILVANNGVYWDSDLSEIVTTLNEDGVPCPADEDASSCIDDNAQWETQMIKMNSRSQAMFDDDDTYPYLTEGNWIEGGEPSFATTNGLMDGAVQDMIDWSIAAASTPNEGMTHWRAPDNQYGTGDNESIIYADFPVYADLSYSNSAYLNAGTHGFNLGDLNWFPSQKSNWEAQSETQYAELDQNKEAGTLPGTSVEENATIPSRVELLQNYPNPFNPTTNISYNLQNPTNVEITVYNTIGKKVATLVSNQMQQAGSHTVNFDASNMSSGIYIYKLEAGDVVKTKKMTLIK